MLAPRKALVVAGAITMVVSPKQDTLRGWNRKEWAENEVPVDLTLDETDAQDFDAMVLPGGVMTPDTLRKQPKA